MPRIDEFMAFIEYISDHRNHTIQDIAHEIGVSTRTIKRYKAYADYLNFEIKSQKGRYAHYCLYSFPKKYEFMKILEKKYKEDN